MNEKLRLLASEIGVATEYSDSGLCARTCSVDDETLRFFIEELGFKAGNDEEIEHSLQQVKNRRWQRVLESIYVRNEENLYFDAVVENDCLNEKFDLKLLNNQNKKAEQILFEINPTDENYGKYTKIIVKITSSLKIGYYDFEFSIGGRKYKSVLAVSPLRCYQPQILNENKLWGYAVQLYSLRSRRNWGIGDFTDLS